MASLRGGGSGHSPRPMVSLAGFSFPSADDTGRAYMGTYTSLSSLVTPAFSRQATTVVVRKNGLGVQSPFGSALLGGEAWSKSCIMLKMGDCMS